jgi:hypothetical protein
MQWLKTTYSNKRFQVQLCFAISIFFIKWFFWMNFSFDVHLGEPFFEILSMCNLAHFIRQVPKGRKKRVGLNFLEGK